MIRDSGQADGEDPTGTPNRRRMGVSTPLRQPDGASGAAPAAHVAAAAPAETNAAVAAESTAGGHAQPMATPAAVQGPNVSPTSDTTRSTAVQMSPVPTTRKRMGATAAAAPAAGKSVPAAPAAVPEPPAHVIPRSPHAQTTGPAKISGTAGSRDRMARPGWVRPLLITLALLVVALLVVLGARWLRTLEGVAAFIATYDGHATQPDSAPVGIPGWLGWQHFLNMFFIVLIVRTGLGVRTERKPPVYWTPKPNSFFSPKGNTPKKISLTQWLHQSLDMLWVANGAVFVVLLFATGHWARIVPTSWDIVPNMVSAAVQYASLDWPVENGWEHYNALQMMAYFTTVFVAAPLAILTGIRLSTWWPEKAKKLTNAYPVEWARALHFPVMLYFMAFTLAHVFLVFFTGALTNLNHMYTSRDVVDAWGLVIFLASLLVIIAAWFLTAPMFTAPLASRMGKTTK